MYFVCIVSWFGQAVGGRVKSRLSMAMNRACVFGLTSLVGGLGDRICLAVVGRLQLVGRGTRVIDRIVVNPTCSVLPSRPIVNVGNARTALDYHIKVRLDPASNVKQMKGDWKLVKP